MEPIGKQSQYQPLPQVHTGKPAVVVVSLVNWLSDEEALEFVKPDEATRAFYRHQREQNYSVRVALVKTYWHSLVTQRNNWRSLLEMYANETGWLHEENLRSESYHERLANIATLRAEFEVKYTDQNLLKRLAVYFEFLEQWQPGDNMYTRLLKLIALL